MAAVTATQAANMPKRECRCDVHGISFSQLKVDPHFEVWAGDCPECERERKLREVVDGILRERRGEIEKRALAKLPEWEAEIGEKVEKEREQYMEDARVQFEEYRPGIAANVRREVLEWLEEQERSKEEAEIFASLRAAER
jgi:hypothetical protein